MDITQILLVIIIVVLTIFLIVLGIEVFFVLKDLRRTLSKFNRVLTTVDDISQSVKQPASTLSGLVAGVKSALTIFGKGAKK